MSEILNKDIGLYKSGMNGVIKDPEDERDFIFKAGAPLELPSSVDLRKFGGEIENQLRTGSCVANATCSALELMSNEQNKEIDLSRLFVYYFAREPYPELKEKDGGAYLRDGFKVCNQMGVPTEDIWEFDESKVNQKPSETAIEKAPDNKAVRYERIPNGDISGIKTALSEGHPVIFGMYVYEEFFYLKGSIQNQNYLGSKGGSNFAGGHAMTIVGYDDKLNGGSFIIENSWSEQWGDNGYWVMTYDLFQEDAMDTWTCTEFKSGLLEPEPKPEPEPSDDIEIENYFGDFSKWVKKELKKIIDFIIEFPSLKEIWESMLDTLRKLWDRFKN